MKKYVLMSIYFCFFLVAPLYGVVETIFHAKVIQSLTTSQLTAERPTNFQQYSPVQDYLEYQYPETASGRTYYVILAYPLNKRADIRSTIVNKLIEFEDLITAQS